jgi:3-hydroxyacyl-CoA dehydrogenase, NAD binding domain/3-hydroxyacyl-CoA dehydrogenase, C-terminal domain
MPACGSVQPSPTRSTAQHSFRRTRRRASKQSARYLPLDRLAAPNTILASSTSTIVASQFTEGLTGRHRRLVAHPVNPPHLVPLVELVAAPWTAPATVTQAKAIYEAVGQVPIVVNREIEGFILNRLQAVLLSEASRLVENGYVTPQHLDKTLKDGLGLRWSFMGPFETIELNAPGGIPDYCRRYGPSLARLSGADPDIYRKPDLDLILRQWGEQYSPEQIAERMRWRDSRLGASRRTSDPSRPADPGGATATIVFISVILPSERVGRVSLPKSARADLGGVTRRFRRITLGQSVPRLTRAVIVLEVA